MTEVEEAVKDCSQCLEIIKDLGPRIVEHTKDTRNVSVLGSDDESANDLLKKKLQREEQRCLEALSLVEETHLQLETCKKELNEAEKERAAAIVYRTAAKALRKQLSEKEEQVRDLSSELSQWEREIRLKEKANAGSARCDPSLSRSRAMPHTLRFRTRYQMCFRLSDRPGTPDPCRRARKSPLDYKRRRAAQVVQTPAQSHRTIQCCLRNPGIVNTTSPTSQPFVQAVVPTSRRRGPTVEYYKLQARLQAENMYKLKLEELFLKIQSLEKALDESNDLHMQVEDALESEINGCQSCHANIELDLCQTMARHSTHVPVHCDGCHGAQAVDTLSVPNREVDQQVNVNISDQKFTYIILIVVGFIAIVIQYVLDSEKKHGNTGCVRPGWAHHHSEGNLLPKLALSDASFVFVPALSEEVSLPWNGVAALSQWSHRDPCSLPTITSPMLWYLPSKELTTGISEITSVTQAKSV
ncbi:hypothetical protein EDB86DRAFT_2829228 [Lactarius hatsudake]|nr:hypothetical protein EDB86DRAFT_2829228 [Lactarius hatsudake]